ncbi:MAG: hypothetical protein B6U89_00945 [Desulfurococcales archaeon ex4484_58]|nr:MAG: hypothetical protein B6U89_00945 [Desulfurococcales archaeon ex4484_58]
MFSKLLLPEFSLIVRGSILGVLLLFTLLIYNGSLLGFGSDMFTYVAETTGLYDINIGLLLKYLTPIILLLTLLFLSIRRRQLIMGFIVFLGRYIVSLLVITIILFGIVIYDKFFSVQNFEHEVFGLMISTILLGIVMVFHTQYPIVAFSFTRVDEKGKTRPVSIFSKEVTLDKNEWLRIKIYGDPDQVIVGSDPESTLKIIEKNTTLTHSYIDVIPVNPHGGYLEIYWRGKIIYKIKCHAKNVDFKELKFTVYFNDDPVGEYTYKVESYKNLIEAAEPVIRAILAKLGLEKDDLREVQFYSKDQIYIPSNMRISDLVDVNEVIVKIYSSEKYLEFLKDLSRKDVFELWETLVKRLEVLRGLFSETIKEHVRIKTKFNSVLKNWW